MWPQGEAGFVSPHGDGLLLVTLAPKPRSGPRQERASSLQRRPLLALANLALLVLIGTLALTWLGFYTDLLPAVTAWLSLGGGFAWLAIVARVIPPASLEELRASAYDRLIANGILAVVLLVLFGGLLGALSALGTITVEARGADAEVEVTGRGAAPTGVTYRIAANDSMRFPRSIVGGGDLTVRASGYPERSIRLGAWGREKLIVPHSFIRPIILFHPTRVITSRLLANPMTLTVSAAPPGPGAQRVVLGTVANYDGRSVYIGCGQDVPIPHRLIEAWKQGFGPTETEAQEAMLRCWRTAVVPTAQPAAGPAAQLVPGTVLTIEIEGHAQGRFRAVESFTVDHAARAEDFPQVTTIDRWTETPP